MKAKRSLYNIFLGLLSQIVTIILSMIVLRLFLTRFGSEVNGTIATINQIYAYIALLEAGVGIAAIQSLYSPVGKNDREKINSILSAANKYYKKTGLFYAIAVIVFAIIYPIVINTSANKYIIAVIILIFGVGGLANFFLYGKFTLLFQAEGKNYFVLAVTVVGNICMNLAKIFLIHTGFNVIIVQSSYLILVLIQIASILLYIRKKYKWINFKIQPDYEAISQNKSVLVHQIAGLIFNNTDMLLLSAFIGMKIVSVYSLYNSLLQIIRVVMSNIANSVTFILGQDFGTNKERFKNLFDIYELYFITLVFALSTVVNIFLIPFVELYTQGITDINYVDPKLGLMFIIIVLLIVARKPSGQAIEVAGHFTKTRMRSVLESIINIIISLILVNFIGIYGILLGTIAALLYRSNDMIIYASKKILERSPWRTYCKWLINMVLYILVSVISNQFPITTTSYVSMIGLAAIYTVVVIILFFSLVSLLYLRTFERAIALIKPYLARNIFKSQK